MAAGTRRSSTAGCRVRCRIVDPGGRSLVKTAVDAIKAYIRDNHLHVGDPLPGEGYFAGQLGVSRAVMREAMGALKLLDVASGNVLFRQIVVSFVPLMRVAVPRAWRTRQTEAQRNNIVNRHRRLAAAIAEGNPEQARINMAAPFDESSARCCGTSRGRQCSVPFQERQFVSPTDQASSRWRSDTFRTARGRRQSGSGFGSPRGGGGGSSPPGVFGLPGLPSTTSSRIASAMGMPWVTAKLSTMNDVAVISFLRHGA